MLTRCDDQNQMPGFLAGGGEATRLILARNWSDHPLGLPEDWPETLKVSLSTILNSPESMILAWGRDDLTFFFNETYFPLLGPRLPWAMGAPFTQVWADAWDQAKPIIDEAFAGRPQRFVDLPWRLAPDRGAADTWWTFSYSRILGGDGEVVGLFIFTNETTQRVLTDAALRRTEDDLRALNTTLEQRIEERTAERDRLWTRTRDLVATAGFDGYLKQVNPAWTATLGWSEEDLLREPFVRFVDPADHAETAVVVARLSRGETVTDFLDHVLTSDGGKRAIMWTAVPETATGLFYIIGRDVTEQREIEGALRQSQKVEAVGQLTGGVAHDFNNLLTVIRGSVDLLRRPSLSEERRLRYIDAISDTADRAAKLTGQLLAFARRQALQPTVFDARKSMAGLSDMIGTLAGSRIRIDMQAAGEPCLVDADPNQFDTAIINIAVNARDAMNGAGTLRIVIRAVSGMPAVRAHTAVAGDFVAVSLSDTGGGIPADAIDRIFEPFYTTKGVGQGTGLGLSQVFGFAKQSGGEVLVESQPGEGATFTLYLPRITMAERTGDEDAVVQAAPLGQGACVLVVEDNAEVGRFATDALRELGYATRLAGDAQQALAILGGNNGPDEGNGFDVVFTDVVMPGMTGIELGREIRSRWPALPVILTSGYSDVLAASGTGGFELLHKPYSVAELSRVLRRAASGDNLGRKTR